MTDGAGGQWQMSGGKGVRLGQENRGHDKNYFVGFGQVFLIGMKAEKYVDWVDRGEG
jgi:hypothetical protein